MCISYYIVDFSASSTAFINPTTAIESNTVNSTIKHLMPLETTSVIKSTTSSMQTIQSINFVLTPTSSIVDSTTSPLVGKLIYK